jgi:hypothetical protein
MIYYFALLYIVFINNIIIEITFYTSNVQYVRLPVRWFIYGQYVFVENKIDRKCISLYIY